MKLENTARSILPKIRFHSSPFFDEVLAVSEQLSDFLRKEEGLTIGRIPQEAVLRSAFDSLPIERQAKIHGTMVNYYETLIETVKAGRSINDQKVGVRAHLSRHGVRIDSEVDAILGKHDSVEIYDFEFTQTYRSPNFFKYVDRSIAELAILPYWEIFNRSPEIAAKIQANAIAILTGEHKGPDWNFIEDNIVKEIGSSRITRLHTAVCAPIYKDMSDEVLGLIHIFDVTQQHQLQSIQ